jgi:RNA polymerase sigma-70 factor (ECF subfamily)
MIGSRVSDLVTLVHAAQAGDRGAFEELYRRYFRMVHGIVLARVEPGAVDDLVQDVFVAALQKLGSLREAAAFGGWLAAAARHRATDHRRRQPRQTELGDAAAAMAPDTMEAMVVLDAIDALPDAYRETLVLRLVEGMTGAEIAAHTGLTAASVRVNLHRGMKQLRARLGAVYER